MELAGAGRVHSPTVGLDTKLLITRKNGSNGLMIFWQSILAGFLVAAVLSICGVQI